MTDNSQNDGVQRVDVSVGDKDDEPEQTGPTFDAYNELPDEVLDKNPSEITVEDLEPLDETQREQAIEMLNLEPDNGDQIDVDAVVEAITGHPERKPTAKEVKVAYASDDITDDEMDAAMGVAVTTSDNSSQDTPDLVDDKDEDTDDTPEPATLEETGLLDDEDQFPWESDGDEIASSSKLGEQQSYQRAYKGVPFEFHEPRDKQQYENRLGMLEGLQDNPTDRQQKQAEKFAERIAHDNITVNEHDLDDVYQVESSDGEKKVIAQSDYPDYDLEGIDNATPVWESMNWYDQMLVGQEMERLIIGQGKFRSGVR